MRQFDPQAGWSEQATTSTNDDLRSLSESILGKPADLYHFNRHGKPLSINAKDEPEDDLSFDKSAETADLILQLFDRLEQVDKTKEVLLRLSSSLQTLDTLHEKEHELANQLQATRQEIESLKEQIQSDMQSAQEVEDTNLKIRKYRKALLSKLAGQLAPTAQKAG